MSYIKACLLYIITIFKIDFWLKNNENIIQNLKNKFIKLTFL